MNKFLKSCLGGMIFCEGLLAGSAFASDNWQDLAQPAGQIVRLWSTSPGLTVPLTGSTPTPTIPPPPDTPTASSSGVDEVNYICAQWDYGINKNSVPFDTSVSVTQITPTETLHFVRMFTKGFSTTGGPWLVRSAEIRGLTPAQIRDRLALPSLPDSILSVDIPASPDSTTGASYGLWTGVAGPIAGFGNGGALQSRILADVHGTTYFQNPFYTYDGIRYNVDTLGTFALAYTPNAGGGNAGSIAAYLDQFIPAPYSDLEDVYTSLDFLNWSGFDPPLPDALEQISPECYGSLPFVALRNSILFANAVLERYFPLRGCQESCEDEANDQPISCNTRLWVQGVGDSGDQRDVGVYNGFDYATYGAIVNADFRPLREVEIGVAGSWLANNIHWDHHFGGAHSNSAKGGLHVSYIPSGFFINGMFSGGYNWTSAHRSIDFPIASTLATVTAGGGTILLTNNPIDRKAYSDQTGYDLEAHFQTGYHFHRNCWWVTPLLRISYFYERHDDFNERGADDCAAPQKLDT